MDGKLSLHMRLLNCASGKQNFPGLAHAVGTLLGAAAEGGAFMSESAEGAGVASLAAAASAGDSAGFGAAAAEQAASKTTGIHERRVMRRFLSRFGGHSTVTVLAKFLG